MEALTELIKRQRDARLVAAFVLFYTARSDDEAKNAGEIIDKLCWLLSDKDVSECKDRARKDIFYHSRRDA